jgi:hypothetical protein
VIGSQLVTKLGSQKGEVEVSTATQADGQGGSGRHAAAVCRQEDIWQVGGRQMVDAWCSGAAVITAVA